MTLEIYVDNSALTLVILAKLVVDMISSMSQSDLDSDSLQDMLMSVARLDAC